MRAIALAIVLGCGGLCSADRLILAPVAKKVPLGTARLEHMFDQSLHGRFRSSLAVGLTEAIDAEISFEDMGKGSGVVSFDVGYNIVPPIVNLSPGISVGFRDIRDKTQDGRFFYAALTEKIGLSGEFNGDTPAEITIGAAFGRRNTAYTAVMLPFRSSFRLLAEFDTRRVSAGLEFRPRPDIWVRWIHRDGQGLWSVTLDHRF